MANNRLKKIHESEGGKMTKLKQDVETRWNSTFEMLKSYVDQHQQVTMALCMAGKKDMSLETNDVKTFQIAEILEPFYEATVEMSSEKNTSISKIIPIVYSLKRFTVTKQHQLAKTLNEALCKRFNGIEDRTHIKKAAFPSSAAANAIDKLKEITRSIKLQETASTELEMVNDVDASEVSAPKKNKSSLLWGDFDINFESRKKTGLSQFVAMDMEVRHYLECNNIDRMSDPLGWWKDNGQMLPRLQIIAKDVLATPATSVPSEQLFSKPEELISAHTSNLNQKNVNMILFLNNVQSNRN